MKWKKRQKRIRSSGKRKKTKLTEIKTNKEWLYLVEGKKVLLNSMITKWCRMIGHIGCDTTKNCIAAYYNSCMSNSKMKHTQGYDGEIICRKPTCGMTVSSKI